MLIANSKLAGLPMTVITGVLPHTWDEAHTRSSKFPCPLPNLGNLFTFIAPFFGVDAKLFFGAMIMHR